MSISEIPSDWRPREVNLGGELFIFRFPGLGECLGGTCRARCNVGQNEPMVSVNPPTLFNPAEWQTIQEKSVEPAICHERAGARVNLGWGTGVADGEGFWDRLGIRVEKWLDVNQEMLERLAMASSYLSDKVVGLR